MLITAIESKKYFKGTVVGQGLIFNSKLNSFILLFIEATTSAVVTAKTPPKNNMKQRNMSIYCR